MLFGLILGVPKFSLYFTDRGPWIYSEMVVRTMSASTLAHWKPFRLLSAPKELCVKGLLRTRSWLQLLSEGPYCWHYVHQLEAPYTSRTIFRSSLYMTNPQCKKGGCCPCQRWWTSLGFTFLVRCPKTFLLHHILIKELASFDHHANDLTIENEKLDLPGKVAHLFLSMEI